MVDARVGGQSPDPGRWARRARRLLRVPLAVLAWREGADGWRLAEGAEDLPPGVAAAALALARGVLDDARAPRAAGSATGLAAPVRRGADGAVAGALCALDRVPRDWDPDDAALLADLAAAIGAEGRPTREAPDLARGAAEASPVILYVRDLVEGRDVWRNRRFAEALGYGPEQVWAMGPAVLEQLLHPDDLAGVPEAVARLRRLPDGASVEMEHRMRHADGSWRRLLVRETPFARGPDGGVTQALGSALDVTGRLRAEEELRAGERRLRLALDAARMGAWEWDLATDGAVVDARARELLGFGPDEEPTGAALAARTHPEDAARMRGEVERLLTDPRADYAAEFRVVRRDGAVRRIASRGRLERDPGGERPPRLAGVSFDVTERAAADAALAAAEARRAAELERERRRLTGLLDGLSEGVVAVFVDEGVTVRNRAWLAFHGFASFDELPPGRRVEDVHALLDLRDAGGEPLPFERGPVGRALRGEEFRGLEVRLRRRDTGREWWGSYDGTAVRDPAGGGAVTLAVVSMRDVSERKAAEAALARSEGEARARLDELETLYRTAPVGLAVVDPDLRILRVNEVLAELNGASVAEHLGRRVADVVPELVPALEPLVRRVLATGLPVRDVEVTGATAARPGLVRHWVEDLYPVRGPDGAVAAVGAVVREETERRRVEGELRRSEARLRLALASAPVLVFEQDRDLRYTWVDRPLPGFSSAQLVGRTDAEVFGPEQAAPIEAVKRAALEAGAPSSGEVSVATGGTARHYDLYVEPRRDEASGAVSGLRAVAVDVTARKEAEAERELLVRELDHRIRNLFAVAGAIVSLCARRAEDPRALARAAQERFAALARAHTVLREHGRGGASGADFGELVATVLAPHRDQGRRDRVELDGPPVRVGARPAVMVGLVLHELATNAAKYGALSGAAGRLRVAWSLAGPPGGERVALAWEERGGPPPAPPPRREGFGSLLVRESVRVGLGGTAELDFGEAGLTARIEAPLARLRPDG